MDRMREVRVLVEPDGPGDEAAAAMRRMREELERDAASVPCGLTMNGIGGCNHTEGSPCFFRRAPRCPLRKAAAAEAEQKRRAAQRLADDRALADRLGIPRIHWHLLDLAAPGESYPPVRETAALVAVMGAARETLVLCGPTGTGKSAAAAFWCWTRRGLFRTAPNLEAENWYGREGQTLRRALEAAPGLVIDDLGVEFRSDRTAWGARLDGLLGARYNEMLPTLITTNLPADQLAVHLGTRIVSRIRQTGRLVECVGDDIRPQMRQEVLREHG
jgi:DNA replication protein DnaC